MIKLHVFRTGYTLVSPAVPNRNSRHSPIAYTGFMQKRSERIKVPVKCFLIEANGRLVLVDTGWGRDSIAHPVKSIGFKLWFASEPVLTEQETLDSWLSRSGVRSGDLDAVILTHMDVDHVGGLRDVSNAHHVYVTAGEWAQAQTHDVRYNPKLWRGVHIETLKMQNYPQAPFKSACDLFGDGSVKVVFTPGHSAGSAAVVVNGDKKFAVISGDDGYNSASWDKLLLPGPVFNKADMLTSLTWVRDMRADANCVGIFAAHDPAVEPGDHEIL